MKRVWLINRRITFGLTRSKIAKMLNISEPAYFAYEKGTRTPKPIKAKLLGKILDFDWTKFYE